MNTVTTVQEIVRITRSSENSRAIRVGILTTRDRDHALNVIREAAVTAKKEMYHITVASRRKWNQSQFRFETSGAGSQDPTALLSFAENIKGGGVVVIEDMLITLNDRTGDKNARTKLSTMLSSDKPNDGTTIIFLDAPEAETSIPSMLDGAFFKLNVPLPNREEIERLTHREVVAVLTDAKAMDKELAKRTTEQFVQDLTGLTHTEVLNAIRDSLALNRNDFRAAQRYLADRKRKHLAKELAMEILDSHECELPVGLDNLYHYLKRNAERIYMTGNERAKGILLIGPPGTGKTMVAKGAGMVLDLLVVKFKIAALMNSLLGESERRFDQAFQTLQAMGRTIVLIDELEKIFSENGAENDGGTMKRITGMLLTWLSDNPYPNFIIGTSNNMKRMGELGLTLTRSGRFDKIFFVDVPSQKARKQIIQNLLKNIDIDVVAVADVIAAETRKFSGADLQAIMNEATSESKYTGKRLTVDMLLKEVNQKRLRVEAVYDSFGDLRRWAELHCEPAGDNSEL